MNREDIIRTAQEAGMVHDEDDDSFFSPSNLGMDVHINNLKRFAAIVAALEAKDEPVAWRDAAIRLGEELSSVGPNGYYDMDAKEWLDWAMEQNPRGKHSLPQRTWIGLTDEEKQEWIDAMPSPPQPRHFMVLVNAIESELKEKNT